jgi:hypothetical protein
VADDGNAPVSRAAWAEYRAGVDQALEAYGSEVTRIGLESMRDVAAALDVHGGLDSVEVMRIGDDAARASLRLIEEARQKRDADMHAALGVYRAALAAEAGWG